MNAHPLLFAAALAVLSPTLLAQVPIGGSRSDSNGGPLQPGVVYHVTSTLSIPAGETLTVPAGAVLKFAASTWCSVSGTLRVQGTAQQPVVCTDLDDDSAGGDTNGNGNVPPVAGRWGALDAHAGGTIVATHLEVRYAGLGSGGAVRVFDQGSLDWNGGAARGNGNRDGVHIVGLPAAQPNQFRIRNVHFTGMARAMAVPLHLVPHLEHNTASGNTQHDVLELASIGYSAPPLVAGTTVIAPDNLIGGVLRSDGIEVGPNATLEFAAGCVIKTIGNNGAFLPAGAVMIDGTLRCRGTVTQPVVFTSWADDAFGGDSNRDGPTAPFAGAWRRVQLNSATCELEHTQVRFGGAQGAALYVLANAALRQCRIHAALGDGLNLLESTAEPVVEDLVVTGCGNRAISGLRWNSMRNFRRPIVTGNFVSAAVVTEPAVAADCVLHRDNLPGGTIVFEEQPLFTATSQLTIEAGVVVKSMGEFFGVDAGRLVVRGTAAQPVVFTVWNDDAFGGDSDPYGPTTGGPGAWRGVYLSGTAPGALEHVRVRFGGATGAHALALYNPNLTARNLRVEQAWRVGIHVNALAGALANALVHDCQTGIQMANGDHDLLHATVALCLFGVEALPAWSGEIVNSIAWANSQNYRNVLLGQLRRSNGSSLHPGLGNLDGDPQFVDPAQRDFRLLAGSLCIDHGDSAVGDRVVDDHAGGSRRTSAVVAGGLLPDLGCHEFGYFDLAVTGDARLGTQVAYRCTGPATGIGALLMSFGGTAATFAPGYGWLTIGTPGQAVVVGVLPVGTSHTLAVPTAVAFVDLRVHAQAVAIDLGAPNRANVTTRSRLQIRP
jgi:hypothetical protein